MEAAPMLLGVIICPMMEEYLRRALLLSRSDPMVFLQRPISATMLILSAPAMAACVLRVAAAWNTATVPATFLVASLVSMHDAGLLYVGVCLLHNALQCGADFGFTFTDGAHRLLNTEQIGQHPLHLPLAQVIATRQRADGRQRARAGDATGNASWQVGFADLAASAAGTGQI